VLPDLKNVAERINKDATEQFRKEQMMIVHSIKDRLSHDGCASNLKVIKKAVMMPEDEQRIALTFKYPTPSAGLMVNPNPAKKKKKKGKKKKKK
jgi:hypothetical protein